MSEPNGAELLAALIELRKFTERLHGMPIGKQMRERLEMLHQDIVDPAIERGRRVMGLKA